MSCCSGTEFNIMIIEGWRVLCSARSIHAHVHRSTHELAPCALWQCVCIAVSHTCAPCPCVATLCTARDQPWGNRHAHFDSMCALQSCACRRHHCVNVAEVAKRWTSPVQARMLRSQSASAQREINHGASGMHTLAVCAHCSEPHHARVAATIVLTLLKWRNGGRRLCRHGSSGRSQRVHSERSTMGQPACTLWQHVRIAVSRTMRVSPPPLC